MPNDLELNARAMLGHNLPPLDELLPEETTELVARRDELLGSFARMPLTVDSDEVNGKAADLVRMMNSCIKSVEAARVARKEPYLAGGRQIDAHFALIKDPITKAAKAVEMRMTVYQREKAAAERAAREAEARRQAAEAEAARKAAEEAELVAESDEQLAVAIAAEEAAAQAAADAETARRAAEASAADLSRSRGELGAVSSLRTFFDFKDLDKERLDLETLRAFIPMDALEKAVRAFVRSGGRELRGVTIFRNTSTVVR